MYTPATTTFQYIKGCYFNVIRDLSRANTTTLHVRFNSKTKRTFLPNVYYIDCYNMFEVYILHQYWSNNREVFQQKTLLRTHLYVQDVWWNMFWLFTFYFQWKSFDNFNAQMTQIVTTNLWIQYTDKQCIPTKWIICASLQKF